mgnify:CR=1 FL=1
MSGIGATAKPKQRFSVTNGPPIPEKPSASASARDSSGTSGQVGPKLNGRVPPSERPPIFNAPDAPSPTTSGRSKYRAHSEQARFSERLRHEEEPPPGGDGGGASSDKKAARNDRRFDKSKFRAEKTGAKLDAARERAAAQKPPAKPNPTKAAVKKAAAGAWYYAHQKIHEVEHENVGVEAVHKTELAGESAVRGVTRFVKHRIRTHPARRVAKLEKRDIRAKADYAFRKLAQEHPEVTSNPVSRHLQKQRLKKQYAKQARTAAKQGARTAKGVAATVQRIGRAVWAAATSHPVAALVVLGVLLLILALQSCVASMGTIGSGLIGAVGAGTYTASDADMLAAEAAYSEMETKLQNEAANYAVLHPGYDEYRYDLDTVGHDPYVLISILSALHDGAWTLDEVQDTLSMLFSKQYQLSQTVTTETSGESEYTVCTVTLHNENLSHLPVFIMSEDKVGLYSMYISTLGNRSDLFPTSAYPNASTKKDYTDYDIPPEALRAAGFTADQLDGTWRPYGPAGCDICGGTGYKGRVGIYQVMPITDAMTRIILKGGNESDIADQARHEGVLDLRQYYWIWNCDFQFDGDGAGLSVNKLVANLGTNSLELSGCKFRETENVTGTSHYVTANDPTCFIHFMGTMDDTSFSGLFSRHLLGSGEHRHVHLQEEHFSDDGHPGRFQRYGPRDRGRGFHSAFQRYGFRREFPFQGRGGRPPEHPRAVLSERRRQDRRGGRHRHIRRVARRGRI